MRHRKHSAVDMDRRGSLLISNLGCLCVHTTLCRRVFGEALRCVDLVDFLRFNDQHVLTMHTNSLFSASEGLY